MNQTQTSTPIAPLLLEPVADSALASRLREQFERFRRNVSWYETHATRIGADHPGRFICVAGGELFVGDEPTAVYARARAAHPGDSGSFFVKYVPDRRNASS